MHSDIILNDNSGEYSSYTLLEITEVKKLHVRR